MLEHENCSHKPDVIPNPYEVGLRAYENALRFFDFDGRLHQLYTYQDHLTDFQRNDAKTNLEHLLQGIARDPDPYDALSSLKEVFSVFSQAPVTRTDVFSFLRDAAETFTVHADSITSLIGRDEETDGEISQLFLYAARYLIQKTSTTISIKHLPVEAPRRAYLDDLVAALDKKFPVLEKGLYKDPGMYGNFFVFYFANTYTLNRKRYVEAMAAFDKFLDTCPERNYPLTRLLEENAPDVQLAAETLLSLRLKKSFGVDPSMILNAWHSSGYAMNTASDESDTNKHLKLHAYNTLLSLKTMDTLESTHPGMVKYLMAEYGIHHFGRYPTELLIEQFEKRNEKDAPQLVIVYPYDDINGTFYENTKILRKLFDEAQFLGVTVRVIEASSGRDVIRKLNRLYRSHGKIQAAAIGGHGSPYSIRFGPSDERYSVVTHVDIRHTPSGILSLAKEKFFMPNAPIALISCSTGQKGGFAQELSKYGLRVTAPSEDTGLQDIRLRKLGNTLSLFPRYDTKRIRKVYKNGKRRIRKNTSV